MGDKMVTVKYIDKNGKVREEKKELVKKKYNSKFPFVYTDFGIYILLPVLVCSGIGYAIDSYLKKGSAFTLCGIVLGGILAITNLYLLLKKDDGSSRTTR